VGYAEASAESISREAGMSKATFYEHFANKEECILALFDRAVGYVLGEMTAASGAVGDEPVERMRARIRAFLESLATHPDEAQTLLVEIIGAGPRAAARRDQVLQSFAEALDAENAAAAERGDFPRFVSRLDPFAVVGAVAELASRQIRLGEPAEMVELAPVIERLMLGSLGAGTHTG
jgi:AcrR family transcriptional regulator